MQGQIIKGIGGFYYVISDDKMYTLKAPGSFRKSGIKPMIGDYVDFQEDNGYILKIHERKNSFYRPSVSNMTQVCVVLAATTPKPDLMLVDKLLIQAAMAGINIVIILNKCDEAKQEEIDAYKAQYSQFHFITCSTLNGQGIDEIKDVLSDNVTFFAGQSGVGKSSIINAIFPELNFEVGSISKKLERGKHTTRHVELVPLKGYNGAIVDTPGFSFYNFNQDEIEVYKYYPEFRQYDDKCRFNCCTHINEPDCLVKENLGNTINNERYARYVAICDELNEMRKKKYD